MSTIQMGISPSTVTGLNDRWAALRRTTPDPNAPDALSPWLYNLLHAMTWIPYLPLATIYVPFLTIRHFATNSFPTWTYRRMIRNRLDVLRGGLMSRWINPLEGDGIVRPEGTRKVWEMAEERGDVTVEEVWLDPVEERFRVGVAVNEAVKGQKTLGYWITPRGAAGRGEEKAKEGERVILHVHGGGYSAGHPLWNHLALEVAKASRVRILSVYYRKPLLSHLAFPGPLLDVFSAHVHLISDLGFTPSSITLLAKSAGAHLSLMLSRYLSDLDLAQPGVIALMAPWCDLTMSFPSYERHGKYDALVLGRLARSVKSAMRWYTPQAMDDPYFTPANADKEAWRYLKRGEVKVYMLLGTREMFEDEIKTMGKTMKEAGVRVRIREDPDGLHTTPLWDPKAMAVFVKDVCETMGV